MASVLGMILLGGFFGVLAWKLLTTIGRRTGHLKTSML
jgi:hypothetical protein